mmetsp:Transcript_33074/g.78346  ORF Transcript_33074/g.78346 Transcript_33074/m.78346 type:complete len:237 (-) Transcript_33074:3358-4068(-)
MPSSMEQIFSVPQTSFSTWMRTGAVKPYSRALTTFRMRISTRESSGIVQFSSTSTRTLRPDTGTWAACTAPHAGRAAPGHAPLHVRSQQYFGSSSSAKTTPVTFWSPVEPAGMAGWQGENPGGRISTMAEPSRMSMGVTNDKLRAPDAPVFLCSSGTTASLEGSTVGVSCGMATVLRSTTPMRFVPRGTRVSSVIGSTGPGVGPFLTPEMMKRTVVAAAKSVPSARIIRFPEMDSV